MMQRLHRMKKSPVPAAAALLLLLAACPLQARTIIITDEEADQMAVLSAEAPRQGWFANNETASAANNASLTLSRSRSFLIRISLKKIPMDCRVTKAELLIPIEHPGNGDARLYVWRMLAEWGTGVCHQYRLADPKPIEWATPGARGGSSDRATRPSAVAPVRTAGELTINVTDDVDLWHSDGAPNRGWLLTLEEDAAIRLVPPFYTGVGSWKLRLTYEPR